MAERLSEASIRVLIQEQLVKIEQGYAALSDQLDKDLGILHGLRVVFNNRDEGIIDAIRESAMRGILWIKHRKTNGFIDDNAEERKIFLSGVVEGIINTRVSG